MNDSKSKMWNVIIIIVFVFGFTSGVLTYATFGPTKEVEISPRAGENVLEFYVDYLKAQRYNVTIEELSINEFREVKDFKAFLWLLEYGNFAGCYVDYGGQVTLFLGNVTVRAPKLWVQFDGIYWEFRCK